MGSYALSDANTGQGSPHEVPGCDYDNVCWGTCFLLGLVRSYSISENREKVSIPILVLALIQDLGITLGLAARF